MMKTESDIRAAEHAHQRSAYVGVVTSRLEMWTKVFESYHASHQRTDGESIEQYLGRICEQDFEDGLEACHFPGLLKTLDGFSERLIERMVAESKVQPIETVLARRAQVVVMDDASFKLAIGLISRREHLASHLGSQTIEVSVEPRPNALDESHKSAVQVIHEALEAHGWTANVVLKSLRQAPGETAVEAERPRC